MTTFRGVERSSYALALAALLAPTRGHAADVTAPGDASEEISEGPETPATTEVDERTDSPEPSALAPQRMILVHIESSRTVDLERFEDGTWKTVCQSPCDIAVPADESYRIDAPGVRTSRSFSFDAVPGQRTVLQVDTASATTHGIGVAATIVGAAPIGAAAGVAVGGAAVLGVVVVIACPFVAAFGGDFGDCAGGIFGAGAQAYWETVTRPVVAGVIGGGVVLGVTGIVLMSSNRTTQVDVDSLDVADLPAHDRQLALPRVATFPVFSGTF
jgi:hypothetical protein